MSFLTDEWRAAALTRAASPRLASARDALDRQSASYRALLPALPERQAGYYHEFFCPRHAVQLVFDPRQRHHHVCPIDGEVFSGEPFDSAWLWSVNDMLGDAALKLAFHAFLRANEETDPSGNAAADRKRAAEILTGYADRYRTMPPGLVLHPNHPGVVAFSGLDESVWITRLAWAHALLGGMLPADVDRKIRDELLRPAAEHLRRVRWPEIHNVTCWNNAAIATLALALDDEALLAEALESPLGLRAQLAEGVRADGFWWEGSLSYHYYTLAALVWTMRALRASGRDFDDWGVLRRMFQAPLEIAFPDLTLPAIHDCWYFIGLTGEVGHGIPNAAGFYETAYAWYGDASFAWVLGQNYAQGRTVPSEALLDGAPSVPDAPAPTPTSYHTFDSGLAVIRTKPSTDQPTYLLLKSGPDARDHGHPDQLSIQLFAGGVQMTADLGTPGYGISLNDTWYRQSASHSTVLLDGQSQPPASGKLDRFQTGGDFSIASASVAWDEGAYAGVRMRRALLAREEYVVDVFRVDGPVPHQIDWLYHHLGRLVSSPELAPIPAGLPGDCGYAHVSDVQRVAAISPRLRWEKDGARLDLFLTPSPEEELYVGTAPANPASEQLSVALRRRHAAGATFLAIFAPSVVGQAPVVSAVQWSTGADEETECVVETTKGVERWVISRDFETFRLT
jgi:hypothetical protein